MKWFHPLNDGGSVFVAVSILFFYNTFPGYAPATNSGTYIGIAIALASAVIYGWIEHETVKREETPSWNEIPWETFYSYLPLMAVVSVLTRWFDGHITISGFQWIVGAIILTAVFVDLFVYLGALVQRLSSTGTTRITR